MGHHLVCSLTSIPLLNVSLTNMVMGVSHLEPYRSIHSLLQLTCFHFMCYYQVVRLNYACCSRRYRESAG